MEQLAIWLDTAFSQFDAFFFNFWHSVAESIGSFFTPVMEAVSFTGNGGICMIILALLLLCFRKTRKAGLCIGLAIAIGALFTNVILKPSVARIRPYEASTIFREYWHLVGAHTESDLSFPSGHTTATIAAMLALVISNGKRYLYVAIPYATLMCISRNYLVAHYCTDIIAGAIIGSLAAVAAFFLSKLIYRSLESHSESKICGTLLNFDACNIFKAKQT